MAFEYRPFVPTIFRDGPYRFFFYSNEGNEPVHIHVRASDELAKFWVNPIILENTVRFGPHELREIRRILSDRVDSIQKSWDEHFRGT